MKKIILSLSFLCFSAVMYAQSQKHDAPVNNDTKKMVAGTDSIKPAETLLVKDEVHDFGKIPQGKPVNYVFVITNTGKTDLNIANVQASCGCTTPEWERDKPIPAGANSKITVGYNAAAEGPFTKLITITYNENLSKQITIKGEVWKTPASSAPVNAGLNDLKN